MEKVICSNCKSENTLKAKYCSNCGYELPKRQVEEPEIVIPEPAKSISKTTKRNIGVAVGVILTFLVYYMIQQLVLSPMVIDKGAMNIASEINKSCPVMVDSETRLDNTIALPGKVFQYYYTLINYEKSQIDTLKMKSIIEPTIVNFVKTNPQLKYQRDNNWTLSYYYKDKNGSYTFSVLVTPAEYK